ncbi:MAG TPA: four helix bundle protein [Puia sp.]|nr:four helix bundle protein [Puia sp.]
MARLEDLEVYKISMEIGNIVWNIVEKWEYFQRDTLGKQLIRVADSIALNISEGYGRIHYKDNKNFCWYSRASAFETQSTLAKAKESRIISNDEFDLLKSKLDVYFKMINSYIKSIGHQYNN